MTRCARLGEVTNFLSFTDVISGSIFALALNPKRYQTGTLVLSFDDKTFGLEGNVTPAPLCCDSAAGSAASTAASF